MVKHTAILLMAIIALLPLNMAAQSQIRTLRSETEAPDSIDVAYNSKKHFWRAAAQVTGLNVGIWAFDRYVKKADYAYISWESIKENLSHGFVWDNDALANNMFLHPYHGGLYFNAARSNGYNFWQSGLFTVAGSAMWELFFEQEYPSINDIIATPVGGLAIGEVTYRLSDMLVRDDMRGWGRFGHEATVLLISPMRGLTRILTGDAWRYRPTPGRMFGRPQLLMEVSTGLRLLGFNSNFVTDRGVAYTAELNLEYGDRFSLRTARPYDYFKMRVNLNAGGGQPILTQVNIMGRLLSREIVDTPHHDLSVGLYQHFDFYDSDTISTKTDKVPYRLGVPASVGGGLMYHGANLGHWEVDAFLHVNALLLGGVLSDHYRLDMRDYNLGSGFGAKTGVNVVYGDDLFSVSAAYRYFRLFTWGYPKGTDMSAADAKSFNSQGDDSVAYFGIADLRLDFKLMPRLYLTAGFTHYQRSTRYRDFADVRSGTYATRLMLTYNF